MYKHCANQVIRQCVSEEEMGSILLIATPYHVGDVLEARGHQQRYYNQVSTSLVCSRMHTKLYLPVISAKEWAAFPNGMNHPMRTILEVELFDLWGMDFMGHFPLHSVTCM